MAVEGFPVELGVGRQVGVVVAHSAVELGGQLDTGDGLAGTAQAIHHVGHFLAQGGGAGGLAVGAGQHGQIGQVVGQLDQASDDLVQGRQQHAVATVAQHQGVGDVVDVFGGAAKVDELGHVHHFGVMTQTLLEPVFHGLHVVVGGDRKSVV